MKVAVVRSNTLSDPDTRSYRDRILTKGSMTFGTLMHHDRLVRGLKFDSTWNLYTDIWTAAGSTLAAGCVKLKSATPAIDSMLNNGYVDANYSEATGFTSDASKYLDTQLIPSVHLAPTHAHAAYFCHTNTSTNVLDMGVNDGTHSFNLLGRNVSASYFDCYDTAGTGGRVAVTTGVTGFGYFLGSRVSNASSQLYRSGTLIGSSSNTIGSSPPVNRSIYLSARNNNGTAGGFAARQYSLWHVGAGLTPAQVTLSTNRFASFQTQMGRI